jgi:putative hydrolase of the HAD superfamily
MIDDIKDVGNFVEFELISENDGRDKKELSEILLGFVDKFKALDLKKADLPYRDFVAKSAYDKIKPNGKFSALLLDLDGTLINSEKAFFESFRKILKKHYGVEISPDDYADNELRKNANLIKYLKETVRISKNVDADEIMPLVYKEYEKEFENIILEESAAVNFRILKQLKDKNIKLGLVSTCKRSFINILIEKLNIPDLFDTIIAREDVADLKPAPDAYIKAVENLNVPTGECVAIEDSRRGIEAAIGAGLKTVRVIEYADSDDSLGVPEYDKTSRLLLLIYNHI